MMHGSMNVKLIELIPSISDHPKLSGLLVT